MGAAQLPALKVIRDNTNILLERQMAESGKTQPVTERVDHPMDVENKRDQAIKRALETPPKPKKKTDDENA